MTTFAVTDPEHTIAAINYLLSNLNTSTAGNANVTIPGNVLVANTTSNTITTYGANTTTQPFQYINEFINLRYANSADGSVGFTTNPANAQYFGVYNSVTSAPSSNPADYSWYQVTGGFGSGNIIYYSTNGGRQVQFKATNLAPSSFYVPATPNVAIDLNLVTTANGTPGARGPIAMAYVVTPSTPIGAGNIALTSWFSASRTNTTAPIGTGLTPVTGDTSNFIYSGGLGQPSLTYTFNGSGWTPVNGQVIDGNLIVQGTITGNQIQANTITGNLIQAATITGDLIAGNTIAGYNIIGNTITGNLIQASTITGNLIAGNTITATNIQTATITSDLIAANTITATNIAVGANITGNMIAAGTITANNLAANVLTANTVVSLGANIGNNSSTGFWLQGNTGNARFGNSLSIGNLLTVGSNAVIGTNLTVGSNAVIGNNLSVGSNATIGNNLTIGANLTLGNNLSVGSNTTIGNNLTVGANALIGNNLTIGSNVTIGGLIIQGNLANSVVGTYNLADFAVTNTAFESAASNVTQITYTNTGNWPNYTRGYAINNPTTIIASTTPAVSGGKILINYQTYISANTNSNYNLVELWKVQQQYQFQYTFNDVQMVWNTIAAQSNIGNISMVAAGTNGGQASTSDGSTWNISPNGNLLCNLNAVQATGSYGKFDYYAPNTYPQPTVTTYRTQFFGNTGTLAGNVQANAPSPLVPPGPQPSITIANAMPTAASANLTIDPNTFNSLVTCAALGLDNLDTTATDHNKPEMPTIVVGSGGNIYSTFVNYIASPNSLLIFGTFETSNTTANLNDIACSASPYARSTSVDNVVVGDVGIILTNSRTFTRSGAGGASPYSWYTSSTTGWASRASPTTLNLNGVCAGWNNGGTSTNFMAVGDKGTVIYSSNSGTTWVARTPPVTANLYGIAYYNGTWIACGGGGIILTSSNNGVNWTVISNPASDGSLTQIRDLNRIRYNPYANTFVAVGQGVIMQASAANLSNWTVAVDVGVVYTAPVYTRLTHFGSWANVSTTTMPPVNQQLANNQVISGTYADTNYYASDSISYYLIAGSLLANNIVYVQGASIAATEYKR